MENNNNQNNNNETIFLIFIIEYLANRYNCMSNATNLRFRNETYISNYNPTNSLDSTCNFIAYNNAFLISK